MKTIFIPYDRANPYQDLLAEQLEKRGVGVVRESFSLPFEIAGKTIRHWKPDVLHIHWLYVFLWSRKGVFRNIILLLYFPLELITFVLVKCLGVKIVWTVHNIYSHDTKFRTIELFYRRVLAFLCDRIIVHSEFARKELAREYRVSDHKRLRITRMGNYTGSYLNRTDRDAARKSLGIDRGAKAFLFFGAIRPYKGIFEAVKAFRGINATEAVFVVAGRPEDDKAGNMIKDACAGDARIRLYPRFIPDDDVQIYMNAADAAVFPYRSILNSAALILAMSFKRAVILPRIGPFADMMDAQGSFMYDPDEENGLRHAMKKALDADLISMGEHNFKKVQGYSWEEMADKTRDIYVECVRGARR